MYYRYEPSCDKIRAERDQYRADYEALLDQQRRDDERRYFEQLEERRRREMAWEEEQSTAATWPEAFAKGIPRIRREQVEEARYNREIEEALAAKPELASDPVYRVETGFAAWLQTVEAARQIYDEEMQAVEAQIAELRRAALNRVAERVERETPNTFDTADAFRRDDPSFLVAW